MFEVKYGVSGGIAGEADDTDDDVFWAETGSFGQGGKGDHDGSGGGSGCIGGVTRGSMQNGVCSGNGYARITVISLS